jgi:predicted short-subunit dehydrogenase-like oxidoreductase (DUF2520 family)
VTARLVGVVGRGRAGGSFAQALSTPTSSSEEIVPDVPANSRRERVEWTVESVAGRGSHLAGLASRVDLVLLCVPDGAVADVARAMAPGDAVIAHVAGSLGLDVLAPHERRGSIHPLASLPNAELGAERLRGATFAVAGDPMSQDIVDTLGGTAITVDDADRAAYHAAACIASNHLVALMAQVERVSAGTGVALDAYLGLVRQSVENVAAVGPAAALTGPAARGDDATLDRHRAALDPSELPAYNAMVELCRRLAGAP